MKIFNFFKNENIDNVLLEQKFKTEEECRIFYESERRLRDDNHSAELRRKLDEQYDDFTREISGLNDKHQNVYEKMSEELKYLKEQNSKMNKEYKDFIILRDNLLMLLRRVNGMMSGIRNEFIMQFAQFSQKYLYVEDEVDKFMVSVNSKKFKVLSKDDNQSMEDL